MIDKKPPSLVKRTKNLGKAVAKHIKDGMKNVTPSEFSARIDVCNECELRDGLICTHEDCGCVLSKKAWWNSEDCPLGKWPKL
jgi:hypothetical protein